MGVKAWMYRDKDGYVLNFGPRTNTKGLDDKGYWTFKSWQKIVEICEEDGTKILKRAGVELKVGEGPVRVEIEIKRV